MCIAAGIHEPSVYSAWDTIQASPTVLSWIKHGVQLPFTSEPEAFEFKNKSFKKNEHEWINSEISRLAKAGAICRCTEKPHFISPISVVPKKSGDFRLIVDLRHLNQHISPPHFVNEDIDTVTELIKPGDKLVTIDIRSCFHHVPIAEDCQQYVCFKWGASYYKWKVLPFGLNCSPYFVNKVLRPFIAYLRAQGIRAVIYVDDLIIMGSDDVIVEHRDFALQLLAKLGWSVNFDKSDLEPTTTKQFIGYIVSTVNADGHVWVKIPNSRITKVRKDISRLLRKGSCSARALARVAGQCISMAKAVLPAKLLLRNIYRLLKSRNTWQDILDLDNPTREDLNWWLSALQSWNGRAVLHRQIDHQISTDASSMGWGAKLDTLQAQGLWNMRLAYKHSNYRELMAILLALHSFLPELVNKTVQILSDNITAVAYLNFQGGPSAEMSQVAMAIWTLAVENNITISAKYLAGRLNTEADYLSRLVSHHEWRLNPKIFKCLDNIWGPHTVDRFASMATNQIDKYNSQYLDPQTSAVDALAQTDWAKENNYVNPPFRLLNQVINLVHQQKAVATVIAPKWVAQRWYHRLRALSVAPPVRIPNHPSVCLQIGNKVPEPLKNKKWKLFAWRIYGGKD